MTPKNDSGDPFLIAFGVYGAVGFQLAISVIGGLLIGSTLDKKWGTDPWLTLTGLILGSVGGFYNLIRILTWKKNRKS
ncbi:MAG: AtpZ/AtpI family protein [Deltaproteobacteria bacterium]|nr:AtpZ/AtpI family protein [Deltaproteobacteria bacterium]